MKNEGLKTFITIAKLSVATILTLIITIAFSSCDKKDVAASTAVLRTKTIVLNATSGNTQSGSAVIAENADHSFNINITLQNTVKDTVMVMHIHNGSIASPGSIAIPLTSIKGTGSSASGTTLNIKTAASANGTATAVTYDNIITYLGYFNVHYSTVQIAKVVANANIK